MSCKQDDWHLFTHQFFFNISGKSSGSFVKIDPLAGKIVRIIRTIFQANGETGPEMGPAIPKPN
jgi:hypothetical protein